MRGALSIIQRLRGEGAAPPELDNCRAGGPAVGTNLVPIWEDLVNGAQIPPDRYVEIITAAALSALGVPLARPDEQIT